MIIKLSQQKLVAKSELFYLIVSQAKVTYFYYYYLFLYYGFFRISFSTGKSLLVRLEAFTSLDMMIWLIIFLALAFCGLITADATEQELWLLKQRLNNLEEPSEISLTERAALLFLRLGLQLAASCNRGKAAHLKKTPIL